MSALDDAALLRAIRANAPTRRGQVASHNVVPIRASTPAAQRQRRHRMRQANGEISLRPMSVNRDDLVAALVGVGMLDPAHVTDAAIADALERQLRDWAWAWGERAGA